MIEFNEKVRKGTKVYLDINYPNLYDSGYDPINTYNFEDNSHLNIKQK